MKFTFAPTGQTLLEYFRTHLRVLVPSIYRVLENLDRAASLYTEVGLQFNSNLREARSITTKLYGDNLDLENALKDQFTLEYECLNCKRKMNIQEPQITITGQWANYPDVLYFCDVGCYQKWNIEDHHLQGQEPCEICVEMVREVEEEY